MKKLLTILLGAFMAVAAYGQYPEVEELDDGATFGEQRTKINDDIRLDNQQSDSLVAHLVRLEGIGDSLAVHNLIIWNNTDAITGQKDDITDLTADVDANTADIGTNTANIATNTGNIADNTTDISTNNAAIGVNTGNISTNATNISNNSISIATNASNISTNSDSIMVHRDDLTINSEIISNQTDAIFSLQTQLDALSSVTGDTTAPTYVSGVVNAVNPNVWHFTFNEALTNDVVDNVIFSLALKENGSNVTIDSIHVIGMDVLAFTDSITSGSTLRVSYTEPDSRGIRDLAGNALRSFADSTVRVFNNLVYPIDYIAWYKFDNNFTDESGNYDGTKSGTITFGTPPADSFAIYSGTTGTDYFTSDINLSSTDAFSLSYRIKPVNTESDYVWSNGNDGSVASGISSRIEVSGTDARYRIRVANGSSSTYTEGTYGDLTLNTWYNIVEIYHKSTGAVELWVNGVQKIDHTMTVIPLDFTGTMYIGSLPTPAFGLEDNTALDEFARYDYALTEALIDSLNTNPFRMPFKTIGEQVPVVSDTAFVFHTKSGFSDHDHIGTYLYTDVPTDFTGTSTAASVTTPTSPQLVSIDSDTALQLIIENGKYRGSDFTIYIEDGGGYGSGYEELYFSYDVKFMEGFNVHPDNTDNGYGGKLPGLLSQTATNSGHKSWASYLGDPEQTEAGITCSGGWEYNGLMRSYHTGQFSVRSGVTDYLPIEYSSRDGYWGFDNTEWFNITYRVGLNTPGVSDGVLNVYINGECRYSDNAVKWRGDSRTDIDMLWIRLYNGGDKPVILETSVLIDNIAIFYYNPNVIGLGDYSTIKTQKVANSLGDVIQLPTNIQSRTD